MAFIGRSLGLSRKTVYGTLKKVELKVKKVETWKYINLATLARFFFSSPANITIVKSGLCLTNANYLVLYLPQIKSIFQLQWLQLIVL